jgi:hypothetical protein
MQYCIVINHLCVCAEAIFSRSPDRERRRSPKIKNGLNSPKHGELKICSSEPRLPDEMCENLQPIRLTLKNNARRLLLERAAPCMFAFL